MPSTSCCINEFVQKHFIVQKIEDFHSQEVIFICQGIKYLTFTCQINTVQTYVIFVQIVATTKTRE